MKPLLRFVEEIRHGIPSHYHVDLENRLAIAWGERKRKRFNIKPRSRGENLLASRENRARIIYLQAQDEDCLLFLAFILAYSPRSCVDFKTTEFVEFRDYALNNIQQKASPETEKLLKTMAIRKGFNQNLHYLNFMQKMFPEGFREQEPFGKTVDSTAAESAGNEVRMDEIGQAGVSAQDDRGRQIERMYSNGPISQVSFFGELLSNAIQSSHQWRKERGLGESTTNCWTTMIPRDPNEDISITIWLGRRDGHRVNTALMVEPTWSSLSSPMPE